MMMVGKFFFFVQRASFTMHSFRCIPLARLSTQRMCTFSYLNNVHARFARQNSLGFQLKEKLPLVKLNEFHFKRCIKRIKTGQRKERNRRRKWQLLRVVSSSGTCESQSHRRRRIRRIRRTMKLQMKMKRYHRTRTL